MKPHAIYFPQFYSTPTNNNAWGMHFTDWALVASANVHSSWDRRAPESGFYDGASPEVHARQIEEAYSAGLGGFATYHYWFYSHQELDAFERSMLIENLLPKLFNWYLIWATEGWSKRWIGNAESLIKLTESPDYNDIERHSDYLAQCFSHPGYTKWRNKPLFAIYNLAHFSNPRDTVEKYRLALSKRGFSAAFAHFVKNPFDLQYCDFMDATYLFEPRLFFGTQRIARGSKAKKTLEMLQTVLGEGIKDKLLVFADRFQQKGKTYTAADFITYMNSKERKEIIAQLSCPWQDVISPGWNNAPRYGERFTALESLSSSDFSELVANTLQGSDLPPLINAWNEWSEGAAIEPCAYYGRRYLDAISDATSKS